ncbi:hypothetical protein DCAR_0311665 [Daucus carota subsp. sativus]|uniref:Uncharacterized protein n=1 Tax=Daucus carota subsp. sativus TaxID=79200 RepID=A0A161WS58_DAUCS|nr:hypothetical protein DCAR_0311665 [Daucus carota subsp. sativus]
MNNHEGSTSGTKNMYFENYSDSDEDFDRYSYVYEIDENAEGQVISSYPTNVQILVATSNRAPDNLYERGLQRYLFVQIIDATLKERCVVHQQAIGKRIGYNIVSSAVYKYSIVVFLHLFADCLIFISPALQAEQGFCFIETYESDVQKQKFEQLIGSDRAGPQEVAVVMRRRVLLNFIHCELAHLINSHVLLHPVAISVHNKEMNNHEASTSGTKNEIELTQFPLRQ